MSVPDHYELEAPRDLVDIAVSYSPATKSSVVGTDDERNEHVHQQQHRPSWTRTDQREHHIVMVHCAHKTAPLAEYSVGNKDVDLDLDDV